MSYCRNICLFIIAFLITEIVESTERTCEGIFSIYRSIIFNRRKASPRTVKITCLLLG